mgnify:CR=1 FL=1
MMKRERVTIYGIGLVLDQKTNEDIKQNRKKKEINKGTQKHSIRL